MSSTNINHDVVHKFTTALITDGKDRVLLSYSDEDEWLEFTLSEEKVEIEAGDLDDLTFDYGWYVDKQEHTTTVCHKESYKYVRMVFCKDREILLGVFSEDNSDLDLGGWEYKAYRVPETSKTVFLDYDIHSGFTKLAKTPEGEEARIEVELDKIIRFPLHLG